MTKRMSQDEFFKRRNDELGLEFDRYVAEHPEILRQIPDGAVICLQIEGDPEFNAWSRRLARRVKDPESEVVYVYVQELQPRRSRIRTLEIRTT